MLLLLEHPGLPSCADCQQWVYDPDTWQVSRYPPKTGLPLARPPHTPLPCWKCPKIPHGSDPCPANAVELSPKNALAYEHYLQCKAVGRFPRDGIVERNAGLIRWAEEQAERNRHKVTETLLKLIAGVKG